MKDADKFNFNQEKAVHLLAEMKTQSEKIKWGRHINSIQIAPSDKTIVLDPTNKKSLLIQPNLVPLESVQMAAAACWGTYDMEAVPRAPLPDDLVANILDPAAVPAAKVRFYERVRRTMIANTILRMLKPNAVTTRMHKKKLFRYIDSGGDTHDDCPTLLKLIFLRSIQQPRCLFKITNKSFPQLN